MVFITLKQETTHEGSLTYEACHLPVSGKHAFTNTTSAASDADNGQGLTGDEPSALKREK